VRSDGAAAATCTARAVLVDMEPKARALCSPAVWRDATAERYAQVVANTLRAPVEQRASWAYNERGTLTFQSGSGNNWARGYNTYGPQCRGRVCELVRREVRMSTASLHPWHAHTQHTAGGGVRPPLRLPLSAEHGWRHRRGAGDVRC